MLPHLSQDKLNEYFFYLILTEIALHNNTGSLWKCSDEPDVVVLLYLLNLHTLHNLDYFFQGMFCTINNKMKDHEHDIMHLFVAKKPSGKQAEI